MGQRLVGPLEVLQPYLEMLGVDAGTFCLQGRCSTRELRFFKEGHPMLGPHTLHVEAIPFVEAKMCPDICIKNRATFLFCQRPKDLDTRIPDPALHKDTNGRSPPFSFRKPQGCSSKVLYFSVYKTSLFLIHE